MPQMAEDECCVCFERFNEQENFPLRSTNCRHITCFACVKQISNQLTNAHVKCPLCRNNGTMELWKPDIEIMERATTATYKEDMQNCSYPMLQCYIFNDHQFCITCHPSIIRYIGEPDLSFSTNNTLCSDCDVYHCLFHENKDNYPPLSVPMSSLVSQDSSHVLSLAAAYLGTYDLHSDSPLICVALLRRHLQQDLKKPLNRDVVYFLLTNIRNSDYFMTIPENRCDELRNIPETYVNFYREYLASLQLIIQNYHQYVDVNIIRMIIEVMSHIAAVINTWAVSIIQHLWENFIETIYRCSYSAIIDLDKQAFNEARVYLVPKLAEALAKHDCLSVSALLSEIVAYEVTQAKAFNVQDENERNLVDSYCQGLERCQNDYEVRYFHYVYKSIFNQVRANSLASRNSISIT